MRLSLFCCALLVSGLLSSPASAVITNFSDNFDGRTTSFAPWVAFSDNGGFPGGYFVASPSTTGPQISALANDGGTNQYLNFYANYDNAPVHNRADPLQDPKSPNEKEAISFFVEQALTLADAAAGETWYFDFDYARNPGVGPDAADGTQVGAFIRVFDPVFNLLDEQTFDTIGATDSFQAASTLSVTINPAWTDGRIQFGFNNLVGSYDPSGMFYDNVRWANSPIAIPEPGSFALLSLGALGFVGRRRRRR